FYGLARNYGVAILLLTLLVRIALFPLTKKQSESMMRMQAFAPKIKELQEKYKDNKQKLNLEMMELYKKEGYNPLKGCLPMLLQFPIFIAMFNLFRTHFELRGAMFIPGWIPDLSLPESIWNFPPGVVLPILGWTAIRLLPFVQAATQILSMKIMQTPDQKSNKQMRVIMYIMPVVFFFILYDMPSGLLVYWTFTNALTMVQHVALTKYLRSRKPAPAPAAVVSAGKKASGAAGQGKKGSSSGAVTPPPKKRKKR
ncbi:MAG: membrane protein insertase YidC, partial [Treponema sp.]|nr:membrane protein insertase YidC [Treponema sp.]